MRRERLARNCSAHSRTSVFNLCNRTDVAATEARVAAYHAANAVNIAANEAQKLEPRHGTLLETEVRLLLSDVSMTSS